MTSPYREIEKEKPAEPKSGQLVYRPAERVDRISAGASGFQLFAAPTAVAVVVGMLLPIEAAIGAFFFSLGGVVLYSRKRPKNVVVLKVAGGELRVFPMGRENDAFSVRLDDLDDVVMETKSVERVMEVGSNAINIGTGGIAPNIGPPSETKRIVLEPAKGSPYSLTNEFFGHNETNEWFAKVRLFLRNVGWTPLAEREEADEEDEEEDEEDDG